MEFKAYLFILISGIINLIYTLPIIYLFLIHIDFYFKSSVFIFAIPIILLIVASIVRLAENTKTSYNILKKAVILFLIIFIGGFLYNSITDILAKSYNSQFLEYMTENNSNSSTPDYLSDIKPLIKSVLENNKGFRKIAVEYGYNRCYTSVQELTKLLKIIPADKYFVKPIYDNKYITKIKIYTYYDFINTSSLLLYAQFDSYIGSSITGSKINAFLRSLLATMQSESEFHVILNYISEDNEKTTFNNDLKNLKSFFLDTEDRPIKNGKLYDLKIEDNKKDALYVTIQYLGN